MIQPIKFDSVPMMEEWIPNDPKDVLITNAKNIIAMPVSKILNINSTSLDYFILRPKKCYNSQVLRDHVCQVVNYFEKYYDQDKELLVCIAHVKYMIDMFPQYTKENFMNDVRRYILGESIKRKVMTLADYNYSLNLTYKNISPALQYDNEHAKEMLEMSILMNFVIPLITHFAQTKRVYEIDEFILDVYDIILHMFDADIFSKLYETAISNVAKSEYKNPILWAKQDIRGKDTVIHSVDSVNNIILNIMPKYAFGRNIIALNYTSILKNTSCQVLDICYEYGFISLSSSKRDSDDNYSSELDKFESSLIKQNESLALQVKVNCNDTVKRIESMYGPFDKDTLNFYRNRLKNEAGNVINGFQKQLIFNLFYSQFGDVSAADSIDNSYDYIKLMLSAKKLLESNYMVVMPYIISSKIEKLVVRKSVNKKEETKIMNSPYYPMLVEKYRNEKVIQQILSTIATIISSTFYAIDPANPSIDGKIINTIPDLVMEECLVMSLMY